MSPSISNVRSFSPYDHSRTPSFASQARTSTSTQDLFEPSSAPWEVVRLTKLRKITSQAFSEVGRRNFGQPTCLAVSTSIIIGSRKGIVLVFDYQQNLKTVIGQGTKAVESGAVTALAISADHTTVGVGHADGSIYTWEIAKSARPFLSIPSQPLATRVADGHISGAAVIHIGFLGTRHTALVSANDQGMAFSHLATRGMGPLGRVVKTARILGRYPDAQISRRPRKPSSVLAFAPLPMGNVEQPTDSVGLVAMLTPYLLVIVSTTPVAETQHKAGRPRELAAHGALTACLAWFPSIKLKGKNTETSKTKLAYCWSNILTVLDVTHVSPTDILDRDKPPTLVFQPQGRWRAEEPIVAVQWISRSVMAVLTLTQQLLILEDNTLRVTDSFDLIHKQLYHADLFSKQLSPLIEEFNEEDQSMHGVIADAFYMSFKSYKGRLFLLGVNDISIGSLSNWADRLLAMMESGDFIGAIRLATSYYTGDAEKLTVGLPEDDEVRHSLVEDKLLEMMSASVKYAFGKNQEARGERLEPNQLKNLADACIFACNVLENYDFLFDEIYEWYEENEPEGLFLDVLEPYVVDGNIRSLPPAVVKPLISHYSRTHSSTRLEEIICLLDTTTMDIEQVTLLCKNLNLYDAYIYVWTAALDDYVGPLVDLLNMTRITDDNVEHQRNIENAMKIFPYMSYILTGRRYPTGDDIPEPDASKAKADIYNFLLSNQNQLGNTLSFPNLRQILEFDTSSFMSMLNEAFEDSFLNTENAAERDYDGPHLPSLNRQYLISILLEVMVPEAQFEPEDAIYFDIFIARNLPKYPQYILLSGSTLHEVLLRLCQYHSPDLLEDCQLSVEYLFSIYHPPDIQELIPLLKKAKFFRILKSVYRSERQFPDLLLTFLEDPEDQKSVFTCIHDCLRPSSSLNSRQRREVYAVLRDRAVSLANIDVIEAAHVIQEFVSDLHPVFITALESNPSRQYQYLNALLEPKNRLAVNMDHQFLELYIRLMCQHNPAHTADYVNTIKAGDLELDAVLSTMESSGAIVGAVILMARKGEVRHAMDRLTKHLSTLEVGLTGILQNAEESPDSATMAEAVADLVQSMSKYTRVGIWLCQGQFKLRAEVQPMIKAESQKKGANIFERSLTFEEQLWLDLIESVVRIARNVSPLTDQSGAANEEKPESRGLAQSLRSLVQQVFTALLASTTAAPKGNEHSKTDVSFLRILRTFLTRAAVISPSLSELRSVISSIFSAYTYEESLLSLANTMLDKDLFVHVDEAAKLRQRGWRPRGQVCEVCRRRVWGPGSGIHIWDAWTKKQAEDARRREAKRFLDHERSHMDVRGKGKGRAASFGGSAAAIADDGPHTYHVHKLSASAFRGTDPDAHAEAVPEGVNGGGTLDEDGWMPTPPPTGPLIVFACRHMYHRVCLRRETARAGERGLLRGTRLDGEEPEFICLICYGAQMQE